MLWTTALISALLLGTDGPAAGAVAPPPEAVAEVARGHLVIVGGGQTGEEIRLKALTLAGGPKARVVVVPQASIDPQAGQKTYQWWLESGATDIVILDLADPKAASDAIKSADLIWMRGGSQERLMKALTEGQVADAIRDRYHQGATVGGTSAGAAVMSTLMIAGWSGRRNTPEGMKPKMEPGLGLWPDVIVDQHFIVRDRIARLRAAVRAHPEMVGVGIDEATAVVVSGREFEVIGSSDVVVLDGRKSAPERARPASDDGVIKATSDGNGTSNGNGKADEPRPREGQGGDPAGAGPPDLELSEYRLKAGMKYHLDKGILPMQVAAPDPTPIR